MNEESPKSIHYKEISRALAKGADVNAIADAIVAGITNGIGASEHEAGRFTVGVRTYIVRIPLTQPTSGYGKGKYKCKYWLDVKHSLLDPSVDLADDDVCDEDEKRGDDGVFCNLPENNAGTHALTSDGATPLTDETKFASHWGIGWRIGWTDDDRPVFAGFMVRRKVCTT